MKRITPPSKEELQTLLSNNSLKTIGEMKGVSHRTVWKWCCDYELPMRSRGGVPGSFKRPDIDTGAILTLKAQGLKPGQIATALKTSRALVAYRLENYSDWKPDKDFHDKSQSLPWDEIIRKYTALKVSGETIAEEHKVSPGVIYRGLVDRGIELRERTAHMSGLWAERNAQLQFARQFPPDWFKKPLDWRILGGELLSQAGYMSNEELARRLLGGNLLDLSEYGKTANEIAKARAFKKRVNEVRNWVKRPGGGLAQN